MITVDSGVAWLPPIAVAVAITGAAVLLAFGRLFPRWLTDLIATTLAVVVTVLSAVVLAQSSQGRVVTWDGGWTFQHGFSVGILMLSDPVGAGIAVLAGVLTICGLVYSWRYFESV